MLIDVIKLLIISVTHSAESASSASLPVLELDPVLEPELLAIAGGVICRMSRPATSARVTSCCAFMMVGFIIRWLVSDRVWSLLA